MELSYMDNAATTRTDPRVVEAMRPYFSEVYGNASSIHTVGLEAKEALEEARSTLARFINAESEEIVLMGCGTEADNFAVKGIAHRYRKRGRHIIISPVEHPAVHEAVMFLRKEGGYDVTMVPVDDVGAVSVADVEAAMRDDTILVSVMHGNNEIGTINPIGEIGALCRERGAYFHTDAVQSMGKVPIDVKAMNVDLLVASAHKVHGPKGVAFCYVRKGVRPTPLVHGGGHEGGLRSGTENVAGVVGFAKAVELCRDGMDTEVPRLRALQDRLIDGVLDGTPETYINGPRGEGRLPHNVNFGVRYVEGEGLMLRLDAAGFQVSTGSACSSHSLEASRTLIAIGLKHEEAHGSIRATLGRWSTEEEVDRFVSTLPGIVKNLHAMSPLYAEAKARSENGKERR
jgi:cysteine desulfurase